jgi:hypothetical protein
MADKSKPQEKPKKTETPVGEFTIMTLVNFVILVCLVLAGGYYGFKIGGEVHVGYWDTITRWGAGFGAMFGSAKARYADYKERKRMQSV